MYVWETLVYSNENAFSIKNLAGITVPDPGNSLIFHVNNPVH